MIIPDEKKAITTIMGRRSPQGEVLAERAPMKPEIAMTEPGVADGLHAAAEDILAAVHSKSAQRIREALANFMDMHTSNASMPAKDEPEAS